MCLPQIIKSFQNYRGVATTFYPTLVYLQLGINYHVPNFSGPLVITCLAAVSHYVSLPNRQLKADKKGPLFSYSVPPPHTFAGLLSKF